MPEKNSGRVTVELADGTVSVWRSNIDGSLFLKIASGDTGMILDLTDEGADYVCAAIRIVQGKH